MRLFIVEDNYYTANVIKVAVEKMGHSVVDIAYSCSEAIEKIRAQEFDVLLLDILLPDGSGFDVLRNIDREKIKIIAITAVDQEQIDEELKKMGVKVILRKPFLYDEIKKVIESII